MKAKSHDNISKHDDIPSVPSLNAIVLYYALIFKNPFGMDVDVSVFWIYAMSAHKKAREKSRCEYKKWVN